MDKPPTFVPWDRSQFLERLRTFTSVINWSPKPDIINEVQWAKWGWKCDGRETVKCVSCSKRIVINLCMDNPLFKNFSVQEEGLVSNNEEIEARPDQAFEALHEKYASMMKEGHYHDCLWSQKGCDASIQRLPLSDPKPALRALYSRFQSCLQIESSLPDTVTVDKYGGGLRIYDLRPLLNNFIPVMQSILRADLDSQKPKSPASAQQPSIADPHNSRHLDAFLLALHGWRGDEGAPIMYNNILACEHCFRRLGLWLWHDRKRLNGDVVEAIKDKLEADSEHREYCPWISKEAQNGGRQVKDEDKMSGWQTLAKLINDEAHAINEREPKPQPASTITEAHPGTLVHSESPTPSEHARLISNMDRQNLAAETREARDAKDKERWAKVKKLKDMFKIKPLRKRGADHGARPSTAG